MIRIEVVDPLLEIPLEDLVDLAIDSPDQYPEAYARIAGAVHSGKHISVRVNNRTIGRWLKVMASKYGDERISIEEITARLLFQRQTAIVEVPIGISDQQLLDSQLLEVKIPALPGTSFEDHLLEVFFGNTLTLPDGLGLRRATDIVTSYEAGQWRDALARPLVKSAYDQRVRKLKKELRAQKRSAELQLLEWYAKSPQVLFQNLFALRVLRGYPSELGTRLIGPIYTELAKLELDLRQVPKVIVDNQHVLDEIARYLDQKVDDASSETLQQLLGQVSGVLEIEFDRIQKLLAVGVHDVTKELVAQVQAKFRGLQSSPRIGQALAELDLLISRTAPSSPILSWEIADWLRWADEEYLPYRYWLENTGQLDNEIGEYAGLFGDWLYKNYGELLYHSKQMAWRALRELEVLQTHSGPVLVVVIDNFNTKFYPDLKAQMQIQGFYEQHKELCLAVLPSCTEVSKKSLITGHYAPFLEGNYKSQVEETWSKYLGKKVKYLGTMSDLRGVNERLHDIYFLNYLALDITLHLNENLTGISHAQTIRGHLTLLSQDIYALAEKIGGRRDLLVVFVSDHGSTRIPKGTTNVIDGAFYRTRAQDEHHRYISYSDVETRKLPSNAPFDCYSFKKQTYDLGSNYLAARRLYRFIPTNEHAYVHGGLTPEETLVPLAIYAQATITPKPIGVKLADNTKIRVGTKLDLILEITNTNNYACEELVIDFIDPNIEAERVVVNSLAPLARERLVIPARCPRTADASSKKLKIALNFNFLGRAWDKDIDIPAVFDDIAKTKFDLDEF